MPSGVYTRTEWHKEINRKAHKDKPNKGHFKKGHLIRNTGRTRFKKGHLVNLKDGKHKHEGYVYIYKPNHPFAINNYAREHRLVVEAQIGRYLKPAEKCHHLGEKDDNRPHMLMAFVNHSAHIRFHKNPDNVKPEEIIFDGRKLK